MSEMNNDIMAEMMADMMAPKSTNSPAAEAAAAVNATQAAAAQTAAAPQAAAAQAVASNDPIASMMNAATQMEAQNQAAAAAQTAKKEEQADTMTYARMVKEYAFNEQELKAIEAVSAQLNVMDNNAILQYGVGCQQKLTKFSDSALETVKTRDLGEVGDMLASCVTELKSFETEEKKGGFAGLFKKEKDHAETLKAKYSKAETNIDKITDSLETHQVTLMKDINVLDQMYEVNKSYFRELSMYIAAGKKKLEEMRNEEMPKLLAKAQQSGLQEDAQAVKDLDSQCNRFEKKIHDLELTRMVSLQMAPQIRMIQSNDTEMVEKIQSTIVNTIPLWKNQMVLALGLEHSANAAKAQNAATELTNELLRKNAEVLKTTSIETAKASERGIVDMETLRITNQSLISTLDEVMKIQREGHQKRMEAETEMASIEKELKAKLMELSV